MSTTFEALATTVTKPAKEVESKALWLKTNPVLSEDRTLIRGGMWHHQRAFWTLPNFIKGLVGGYGSGKTNVGSKRVIASALTNAPAPVAVISPTYKVARETTILTICELLAGKQTIFGRSELWWKFNKTAHEFKIRFRGREARILIYSGDNPLGLRGPNLAAAWIDEPFIQDREVFMQMIARVRHPEAVLSEILLTGTPESLNFGYEICEGDEKENYDIGYITASTRANKVLLPGYVERLEEAYTTKAAEAYIDGGFVNMSEGMVFYAFNRFEHCQELEIPEGIQLGCGMDFNVNPMAMIVFWRAGNHMHFVKEYQLPNADTEFACEVLREEWGDRLTTIYPDATGDARKTAAPGGKTDFYYIRKAGFDIQAKSTNPKRRDSYNAVNGKFKPKNGEFSLSISKTGCKKLKGFLLQYSYELMNKQEKMSHLLDAFRYPVTYLFPVDGDMARTARLTGF